MAAVQFHIDIDTLSPVVENADRIRYPHGISIGPRIIDAFEIVLITEGTGTVTILDHTFTFQPGDLFIIPPGIRHAYRSAQAVTHYYVYFHLSQTERRQRASARRIASAVSFSDISLSATHVSDIPFRIPAFPAVKTALFEALAARRKSADLRSLAADTLSLKHLAVELLAAIIETAAGGAAHARARFSKSTAYISAHLAEPIRIDELAALEGITPNYFTTEFSRQFGMTPVEYLSRKRVAQAKMLLAEDMPIHAVAARTGFRDQYYFSNVFKKYTGSSPRRFRAAAVSRVPG
ncbi:MAG: helix-turn-helix domain-containing protein [Spirochaetes bacterium]|nr:helix-turn-helix domain-containing protein [Spirochaetota bacterium]